MRVLLITTLLFLSGCVERQIVQDYNNNIEELNNFSEVRGKPPAPDKPVNPQLSAVCMPATVQARDIDLIDLAEMLSTLYNTSINYTGNAGLKVSLKHQDSCLRDVLKGLTETYNIGFAKVGSAYTLYPPLPMTKLFKVSYHNFERTSSSSMTVNNTNTLGDGGNSSSNNDNHATIETKTSDLFWENLEKSVQSIINDNKALRYEEELEELDGKEPDYGQEVTVYRESGVIVVRALPRALMKVDQFLTAINVHSLKQVIIEAKILEVELTEGYQQGIDWRALKQGDDYSLNMGKLALTGNTIAPSQPLVKEIDTSVEGHLLAGTFRSKKLGLNGIMQVLSTQGKVSVLSSPRVSALNNQRALVKFGEDKYYLTGLSNTSVLSNNGNTNGQTVSSFELDSFFSGIALDTTPKIISSEEVILHMHPMITMIENGKVEVQQGKDTSVLPTPVIKTRETDTVVRAYSGDVIVIGGLVQNKATLNESGSPFRRPGLLNKLLSPFQNKSKTSLRSELVILLKPTIVDSLEASSDFDKYTTK